MKVVEFKQWNDFRTYVDEDLQVIPRYWRGQKDPRWPLASLYERSVLRLNGGWKESASNIYPYDGRLQRKDVPFWKEGFYQAVRDRHLEVLSVRLVDCGGTIRSSWIVTSGGLSGDITA